MRTKVSQADSSKLWLKYLKVITISPNSSNHEGEYPTLLMRQQEALLSYGVANYIRDTMDLFALQKRLSYKGIILPSSLQGISYARQISTVYIGYTAIGYGAKSVKGWVLGCPDLFTVNSIGYNTKNRLQRGVKSVITWI